MLINWALVSNNIQLINLLIQQRYEMRTLQTFPNLLIVSLIIFLGMSSTIKIRNLQQSSSRILQKEVYVTERSGNYYNYRVYSDNGKTVINLYGSNMQKYKFTFESNSQDYQMYFRAAYNKFIIVEQMSSENKSLSYWLLIITSQTITSGTRVYSLDSFAINSIIDNQAFQFNNSYLLKNIVEYNELNNILYVTMDSETDSNIYAIDLSNRGNIMLVIGYFYYSNTTKEKITDGNSRVLVETTTDSLWFNAGNLVSYYIASIYNKVNVSSLTNYPIYEQSSKAYSFLSSYFQYVSLSPDGLNLTTFIFGDYVQTTTIYGEAFLTSVNNPIKIISDQQNFFLAIADNDIYISTVTWNTTILNYSISWNRLTLFTQDQSVRNKWLDVFNSIIIVVLVEQEFFMLSQTTFYVYSQISTYEQQLSNPVNSNSNLKTTLYTCMKDYFSNSKTR